jgi:hypothetical protein
LPEGVEVRDAVEILPRSAIIRTRSGSVAPFADWFRVELQRRGLGTWVDADMYLLRQLDGTAPCLFGEEEPGLVNNAVLRIAPDSPLIPMLLEMFETGRVPSWLPARFTLPARMREWTGRRPALGELPFGVTGPFALTAALKRLGISSEALPPDVFNPVRWQDADWIRRADVDFERIITPRTVGIHLWNECIKAFKDEPAPPGSFLERLHREGG